MATKLSVPLPYQPFNYQRAAAGGVKTRKKSRNNKIKTLFKFSPSYHNFADNVMKITLIVIKAARVRCSQTVGATIPLRVFIAKQ